MADITSTSNPRVKQARKLQRKRHRDESGLCLLEGARLIEDAWRAGAVFDSVYVVANAADAGTWATLIGDMRARGVAVFTVTGAVLSAMTETVTPQGIAALVKIPDLVSSPTPHMILVLDRVRDPGNAGTLLRSSAAAGVDLVIFGPETVDPFNDKVLRAAMGAHFRIPLCVCADWADVAARLGERPVYVAEASAALRYDEARWDRPCALVVGGEAAGPGDEAIRHGAPIAIPMHGQTESLNAAVAGSVILFEAARQRRQATSPPH
ncbi:MAG: RNA methyltransferase [Caldilineaceae bacterium]